MGIPGGRYRLALHLILVVCDTQGRAMLRRVHQSRVDRQLRHTVFPAYLIDQPDNLLPRRVCLTGAGFRNTRALLAVNYRQRQSGGLAMLIGHDHVGCAAADRDSGPEAGGILNADDIGLRGDHTFYIRAGTDIQAAAVSGAEGAALVAADADA